ncbi:MAG: MBL fold metallo-hydrolase [Candidatus Firestonebacteria bacterium]
MIEISEQNVDGNPLEVMASVTKGTDKLALYWIGQAGFAFCFKNKLGLIDPYLSDYLAKKYKDTKVSHIRMMSAPLNSVNIRNLDLVFCSHSHSDHMDPETLRILAKHNTNCKFVIPKAVMDLAIKIGLDEANIQAVNAGEKISYNSDIKIEVIPASHEEIKFNKKKEHYFLGFILKFGNITIYHSGDCVLYDGLKDILKTKNIDIALLPINGRDLYRKKLNILGNFTFEEALDLCSYCKIPTMFSHHFGMFAFNTVNVKEINKKIKNLKNGIKCFLPDIKKTYIISK